MEHKKRFLLLMGITLLLAVLSYFLAISKTLALRSSYVKVSSETTTSESISRQLQILARKEMHYDSILSTLNLTDTSLENNLLRTINRTSNEEKVTIKDFKAPHKVQLEGTKKITYNFTLEGDFTKLLKVIYMLEKNGTYGSINHLNFIKQKDFRTRKTTLSVDVLIQNIQ